MKSVNIFEKKVCRERKWIKILERDSKKKIRKRKLLQIFREKKFITFNKDGE